jgi:hypothetical protein
VNIRGSLFDEFIEDNEQYPEPPSATKPAIVGEPLIVGTIPAPVISPPFVPVELAFKAPPPAPPVTIPPIVIETPALGVTFPPLTPP